MAELQAVGPPAQGPASGHTTLQMDKNLAVPPGAVEEQVLSAKCPLIHLASGPPWGAKVESVPASVNLGCGQCLSKVF